jgi:WD40 repeat protein
VWNPTTGAPLHTLGGHTGTVYSLAFTTLADGTSLLASASDDHTVRLWYPITGTPLRTLTGHTQWVAAVAFITLPDGTPLLASAGGDRTVRLWNPISGAPLNVLTGHNAPVRTVAFTVLPDGTPLLASAGRDRTVRLWNPATGTPLDTLTGHAAEVQSVAFTTLSDGTSLLASASNDRTVRLWNPTTGAALGTLSGHTDWVYSVALTTLPDGTPLVASASDDHTARLWNPLTAECLAVLEQPRDVFGVVFGTQEDGVPYLATGCKNGLVRVYPLDTVPASRSHARWSPLPGSRWRVSDEPAERVLTGHTGSVYSCTYGTLPDGTALLASASADRTVRLWNPSAGTLVRTLTGHTNEVNSVAFTTLPDGTPLLASASDDRTVRLWNPSTGTPLHTLTGHTDYVYTVAFGTLPDGTPLLASAGFDNTVRLWNPGAGTLLHTLAGHTGAVLSVASIILPDGTPLLASAGGDDTVRLWNPSTGALLHTLDGHTDGVLSVAFLSLPDGTPLLASGGEDSTVRLWDPSTGTLRHALTDHSAPAFSVAFTTMADGTPLLVSASDALRLYDPVLAQPRHTQPVERPPYPFVVAIGMWANGARVFIAHPRGTDVVVSTVTVTAEPFATVPQPEQMLALPRAAQVGVVALGVGGLDVPLAVLAGTMNAIAGGNSDLAQHPGVAGLRMLRWPAPARVGLAALLLEDATWDRRYHTPERPAGDLYAALDTELTGQGQPAPEDQMPPDGLMLPASALIAAERIDDRMLAVLRLLGPDAVTVDPLLPLRLRDLAPVLPGGHRLAAALNGAAHQVQSATGSRAVRPHGHAGTVEFARTGTPANLLATQLALPAEIFTARHLSRELIYRLHNGPAQPRLTPTVIVLDTTPGTFGPIEAVLRLAAHVLTFVLHRYGQEVTLIGLDAPTHAMNLLRPEDATLIWSRRTLHPPDLPTALAAADARADRTIVAFTQHHLVGDEAVIASARLRVFTSNAPGDPPRRPPSSPFHLHLPADAHPGQIGRAVLSLIERT